MRGTVKIADGEGRAKLGLGKCKLGSFCGI